MGGGAELTTACDFRVMSSQARMQFVQLRMGTSTGWGGGSRLVDLVGRRTALDVLLSMRRLSASDCQLLGLCDVVTPAATDGDQFQANIFEKATQWFVERYYASSPPDPQTFRRIKQMVHAVSPSAGSSIPSADRLLTERRIFGQLWGQGANLKALTRSQR